MTEKFEDAWQKAKITIPMSVETGLGMTPAPVSAEEKKDYLNRLAVMATDPNIDLRAVVSLALRILADDINTDMGV